MNRGPTQIQKLVEQVNEKGYNIQIHDDLTVTLHKEPYPWKKVNVDKFFRGKVKFGIVADTQLGSKFERLDILHSVYDIFKREKIGIVYMES